MQTGFLTQIGACANVGGQAQPRCFFSAYDDIREVYVLLMEDFGLRALTAGDQITGGPAPGAPPSLEAFTVAFQAAGDLNGKLFNCVDQAWKGTSGAEIALADTFFAFDWPSVAGAFFPAWASKWEAFQHACPILGVELPDDIHAFCEAFGPLQAPFFQACKPKERGGISNTTIGHGDFRLDNIFFKKPGSDEVPIALIDFQLIRQFCAPFDAIVSVWLGWAGRLRGCTCVCVCVCVCVGQYYHGL